MGGEPMKEIHQEGIHVLIDCDNEQLEHLIRAVIYLSIAEYQIGNGIEFSKGLYQYILNKKVKL